MDKNILLIDKPSSWTSFDVVAKLRNAYRKVTGNKKAKVGHAGTLDPCATGLLIVLLGEATKKQDRFMKLDKEYEAVLKLGFTSTTGDPEGIISSCNSVGEKRIEGSLHFGRDDIEKVIQKFTGEIKQIPHSFSAIKIEGKRAYELARAGQEVKIEPRKVTIYALEVIEFDFPNLRIRVNCSSGTYIRTLAEDIGKELNCGAYLTELRRTKIGDYNIDDGISVDEALEVINLEKNP